MGSRFQCGLDRVEAHLEAVKRSLDSFEARMESMEDHIHSMETHIDSMESRIATLEIGLTALGSTNEAHHQKLFSRLDRIEVDLKKFVALVNDTILHYADEMDSVRDRLDILENEVGIPQRSE